MDEQERVVALVRSSFSYLGDTFGYTLTDVVKETRERDVFVTFSREDAFVRVCCSPPCWTSIRVGRFPAASSGKPRLAESYWHIYLVRDAHPEDEARLVALVQQNAGLRKVLKAFAASLLRSGTDLLEGDYSRASRLRRLRAEDERRRNQQEWGTATGETPRFTTRPTLAQLFADATNEGVCRDARCYQAFWDYDFSLAEIATYLETDEGEVQHRLDRWEGL